MLGGVTPKTVLLVLTAFTAGCLVRNLRVPAEDHAVQARTIAERCAKGSYGDGPCPTDLQDDVDAMADQADCVLAITKGKRCAPADGESKDGSP